MAAAGWCGQVRSFAAAQLSGCHGSLASAGGSGWVEEVAWVGAGYCWVLDWEQQLGTDVDLELRPGRQFWNVTEDSKSHENVPDSAWILSQGLGM